MTQLFKAQHHSDFQGSNVDEDVRSLSSSCFTPSIHLLFNEPRKQKAKK